MKLSLAAKLLFGGAAATALGSVLERAGASDSRPVAPPPRKWFTVENTANLLTEDQVTEIYDYADQNGLTFYEALQAYCDHWNGF